MIQECVLQDLHKILSGNAPQKVEFYENAHFESGDIHVHVHNLENFKVIRTNTQLISLKSWEAQNVFSVTPD